MNGENTEAIKYSIKELINDVRIEQAKSRVEFTQALDRIESKLDSKADVSAMQALATAVQNIQVNGSIQAQRAEKEVKDLEATIYLREQHNQTTHEDVDRRLTILETIGATKEDMTKQRWVILGVGVTSLSALATVISVALTHTWH